jgi:putative transposase
MHPGKPMENGHIESFNGRLRDECLNVHQLLSLEDACLRLEAGAWTTIITDHTAHRGIWHLLST